MLDAWMVHVSCFYVLMFDVLMLMFFFFKL